MPEDEAKFTKITYNYYEQLNGYTYLKSLGIGYHFYQGRYTDAIHEVLDTDKKTILHIPHVRSGESTKDKVAEVDSIIDSIGEVVSQDPTTGVITVERNGDGKMIKVADLVNDDPRERDKIVEYLRTMRGSRRHGSDHRAGDGEGGLRLALLRACADGRLPRLADGDHPDHRPLHPRLARTRRTRSSRT